MASNVYDSLNRGAHPPRTAHPSHEQTLMGMIVRVRLPLSDAVWQAMFGLVDVFAEVERSLLQDGAKASLAGANRGDRRQAARSDVFRGWTCQGWEG
jgi:hypothetical protein